MAVMVQDCHTICSSCRFPRTLVATVVCHLYLVMLHDPCYICCSCYKSCQRSLSEVSLVASWRTFQIFAIKYTLLEVRHRPPTASNIWRTLAQTLGFYKIQGYMVAMKPDDHEKYINLGLAGEFSKEYEAEKTKRNASSNRHRANEQENSRWILASAIAVTKVGISSGRV